MELQACLINNLFISFTLPSLNTPVLSKEIESFLKMKLSNSGMALLGFLERIWKPGWDQLRIQHLGEMCHSSITRHAGQDGTGDAGTQHSEKSSYTYTQIYRAKGKLRCEVLTPVENALLRSLRAVNCIHS